jgi:hypothetical protein
MEKKISPKAVLLKEIREYFEHECRYNPTLIKQNYGFKNEKSILELVENLTFKF